MNTNLFPKFCDYSNIIKKREYKGNPLPDVPVSSVATRSITKYLTRSNQSNVNDHDNEVDAVYIMMNDRFNVYIDYLNKLSESLNRRFSC